MDKSNNGISAIPTSLAEIGFLLFFILMTAFISKELIGKEEEQECEQCQDELETNTASELISRKECKAQMDKAIVQVRQDEQKKLEELISLRECREQYGAGKEPEGASVAYAALGDNEHNLGKLTNKEISEVLVQIAEQAEKKGIAISEIYRKLGEGIPPCWRDSRRKIQYLYDAYIYEDGIELVSINHPDREMERLAIPEISSMPNERVNIIGAGAEQFQKAARAILKHSDKQGSQTQEPPCRHYVTIYDRAKSKDAYKNQRLELETYFYKHEDGLRTAR